MEAKYHPEYKIDDGDWDAFLREVPQCKAEQPGEPVSRQEKEDVDVVLAAFP